MDGSTITEHLSPPMYSELPSDVPHSHIGAEYRMLPPSGVFTNMSMEGGDNFHIVQAAESRHNTFRGLGSGHNGMESAYSGYAPSQAFSEHCSSQNYAVNPNQSEFPYSHLGHYSHMQHNAGALGVYDHQSGHDLSTYMMCPSYKAYQTKHQNSSNHLWYTGMQQQESGFPFGYQQSPLQSETTYSSNFRFLHGKGNNFNHFPNGTNMDLVLPRGANELYS